MSQTKIFKHITPIGMVMLTESEVNSVDHVLADLVFNQKEKEGSTKMNGSMTGSSPDNAPKAARQSKNVPIHDNLEVLRARLRELHSRLDGLKDNYAGEPSIAGAKGQDEPPAQIRSMLVLINELPGDLVNITDQVGNAIEKVTQLQDMIL